MRFLLFVEVFVAFIVGCADSVAEETPRPPVQRVARAVLWPATVVVWFTHRNLAKLARFGAIVWLLLTGGWLLSLEHDLLPRTAVFLGVAEATMAFVVYCVDAMSADLQHSPVRRVVRSVLWFKPLTDYLRDKESIQLVQASVTVWVLLTSGWLLSLMIDRIGQPLGWLTT
ncbi:MAG: hypothetical protein JWP02_1394 [Acidimicrobiales bacterium]|nr:hypothetical protein [Acidimicrobiales bacterium]